MKKLFFFLFLLSANFLSGQIICVKDSLLNTVIENVNVTFKKTGVSSNKHGIVDISIFKSDAFIEFSHVAYHSKKIKKNNIDSVVLLTRRSNILPTIELVEEIRIPLSEKHNNFTIKPSGFNLLETSVSELLAGSSPVLIQESQAGGGSPNYRGMEANRLLLVVDNIPLNNAIYRSGHLQSSSTINPFFIESIKLLSGPSSVSYGNGAMGGALVFNTKKPKDKTEFYFNQQFKTSSKAVNINFLANYYKKKTSFLTGFSLTSSGNIMMGKNRSHGYADWGAESIINNNNEQLYTSHTKGDFIHKTKYAINKSSFVLFNTQYSQSSNIYRFDKMNDLKNDSAKYKHWYYGPQTRFMQSVGYTIKKKFVVFDKSKTTIAFQKLKESRHKQLSGDLFSNNRFETVKIYDFNLDLNKTLNNLTFSYGLGSRIQNIQSNASLTNNNLNLYNTTRYPSGGSYVKDDFFFSQIAIVISKKTDVLLGLRLNNNTLSAKFDDDILDLKSIKNNNFSIIKSASLFYNAGLGFNINASYYGGFRNPNVDDLGKVFSKDGINVVVPNENLEPEYAENFEISLDYHLHPIKSNLQLFHSTILNAISREYGRLNGLDSIFYDGEMMRVQMNKNIEKVTLYGFSFYFDYNLSKKLLISSSCNYLEGVKNNQRPASHIPPFNAKLSIDYKLKGQAFSFYTKYNAWKRVDDYDDLGIDNLDEATLDGNPSWYTLNFGYSTKIDKNIIISILAENLLDTHYKTFASGISASGRCFVINLNCHF